MKAYKVVEGKSTDDQWVSPYAPVESIYTYKLGKTTRRKPEWGPFAVCSSIDSVLAWLNAAKFTNGPFSGTHSHLTLLEAECVPSAFYRRLWSPDPRLQLSVEGTPLGTRLCNQVKPIRIVSADEIEEAYNRRVWQALEVVDIGLATSPWKGADDARKSLDSFRDVLSGEDHELFVRLVREDYEYRYRKPWPLNEQGG